MVRKTDEFTVGHTRRGVALQQYSLTGTGVAVAVVDSGIGDNHDMQDSLYSKGHRLLAAVNFVPDHPGDPIPPTARAMPRITAATARTSQASSPGTRQGSTDPDAVKNHGQDKKYTDHFYGVARDAGLVNVRVLDDQGGGTVGSVLAGIQWVVVQRQDLQYPRHEPVPGPPGGESYTTDPLCQAAEAAWKAGIVVVCAAGNNGRLNGTHTRRAWTTRAGARPTGASSRPATTPTSSPSAP